MSSLIINITANDVYKMDDHMFNVVSASVGILSILIAIIAAFVGIYGWITFHNVNRKVKIQNNKIAKKIEEMNEFKQTINKNFIKMQKVNVHTYTIKIMNILNKMEELTSDISIRMEGVNLCAVLEEMRNSIPDEDDYGEDYIFFLTAVETAMKQINDNEKIHILHKDEELGEIKRAIDSLYKKIMPKKLKILDVYSDEKKKEIKNKLLNMENLKKKFFDKF